MLPEEFQRNFVWDIEKTFDLFDSFVRDIFVGSLIYGIPSKRIYHSALVETLACPLQLPCWLAVAQRPTEPLGIYGIALLRRDFNNGGRAAHQTSLKAVHKHFFDSQCEDAEDALNIFTDQLVSDQRLHHRDNAIAKRVFGVRKVPSFNTHLSELLIYFE